MTDADLPTCGCLAEKTVGQVAITTDGFDATKSSQIDGVTLACAYCNRTWPATATNLVAMREFWVRAVAAQISGKGRGLVH